ncbi:RING-H2 finger protein ATL47-like [Hordeum vulgare]|uniref:RING-type E3 ubiquitin transferase n=1 Tax=Hordeum vulgare subsp. vulgare TaxID=112509 RepID=A0A8I6Y9K3_HORVV|nr:RING-H2 finger protein ATL47-like [Hordeum vulgare subsp. vulgare]KAE8788473.1 RING-H2 finger protein ATL47-like [Hordeum vulgare]
MLLAATPCCFLADDGVHKSQDAAGGGGLGISSVALVVVLVLAALVFVSGLLHLLLRFLRRARTGATEGGGSEAGPGEGGGGGRGQESALQRQLQQLFHLHDSGLDQAVIDALPVFLYGEVVVGAGAGAKEPFDCAVCLCEFAGDDRLRLLPLCGHAFHIDCIDTWLLSNSTCPLCRRVLAADDDGGGDAAGLLLDEGWTREGEGAVFPVRLGKFKSTARATAGHGHGPARHDGVAAAEEGDASSSLDARRCYSMGSYQYVLAEASLQVSVHRRNVDGGNGAERMRGPRGAAADPPGLSGGGGEGKRISAGSKGDSFSVSKIWQWPRNGKGKLPVLASDGSPAVDGALQWPRRSVGES